MTDIPAMMLWTDAYMGDTSHLTTTEHGAYLLILMAMWRNGGTLPDDDIRLARTARLSLDKWRKIEPTIRAFMISEGGVITQKRLKLELEIATGRREKLSAAGATGGRAKALKYNKRTPSQATGDRVAMNKQPEPEPEPYKEASPSEKAQAPELDEDADLFRRGRELLGRNAGGQIAKLKTAFQGSVPKARAAVEQAFGRDSPSEYIAGVIRRQGECPPTRAGPVERSDSNAVGRNILAELRAQREQNSHPGPDWDRPEIFSAPAALQIR